ncbi:MAG: AbrB family transcriptional regulator [Actinomycetes bacterium]
MSGRFRLPSGMPPGLPALAGGLAGAALLTLLHVPAGGIVGAVAGSAAVASARERRPVPVGLRTAGMVLLGCVVGVRLEPSALSTLLHLAVPLLAAVAALMLLDVLLAMLLVKRYGIDPVTALLACAPGGVSEISLVAETVGARTGVVVAVHVVRVVAVVVVALPVLVALMGPS